MPDHDEPEPRPSDCYAKPFGLIRRDGAAGLAWVRHVVDLCEKIVERCDDVGDPKKLLFDAGVAGQDRRNLAEAIDDLLKGRDEWYYLNPAVRAAHDYLKRKRVRFWSRLQRVQQILQSEDKDVRLFRWLVDAIRRAGEALSDYLYVEDVRKLTSVEETNALAYQRALAEDSSERQDQQRLAAWAGAVRDLVRDPEKMKRFRTEVRDCFADRLCQREAELQWDAEFEAHADALRAQHQADGCCATRFADPPEPGWDWRFFPKWQDAEGKPENLGVCGWAPPTLLSRPEYEPPLPLPTRPLSPAERFTVLAVIHDGVYKGVELIDPWEEQVRQGRPDDPASHAEHLVYFQWVDEARRIPSTDLLSINEILADVKAEVSDADELKKTVALRDDLPSNQVPGNADTAASTCMPTGHDEAATDNSSWFPARYYRSLNISGDALRKAAHKKRIRVRKANDKDNLYCDEDVRRCWPDRFTSPHRRDSA